MDMGTQPYALASEEGQAVWFLGTLVIMKATGEQTGGAFGLIDNLMPGGFASPYHMHRNEDESFYVVEGEMTFYVGEEKVKAEPGAFVYGPRGVPHGFEVHGEEPVRILLQNYPAGFEKFPVEVGEPAKELSIPPAEPPDMERTDGDSRQVRHRYPGAASRSLRSSKWRAGTSRPFFLPLFT